ncbi:MAG TPA: rhomboid family intramembrane serine protease [Candidatus Polarisedimenticolaceae bacterium]|nr:rhomboid family intramembrane serine protease [Candidatus Polarisedimenticolaceae bacterium]
MLPLGDDNSDRRSTPLVTWALIAANVLVFVLFQGLGGNQAFTYAFATVPAEIVSGKDLVSDDQVAEDPLSGDRFVVPGLQPTPGSVYVTLLTSMFMHGGLMHLLGNMLFLWIFGDNVEDRLGKGRYLVFYLLCGLLASLAHVGTTVLLQENALVPSLGASGAISGVLAGYLALFPHRRVRVLLTLGFFARLTEVPAIFAIGMWFVFQLISGIGMLGARNQQGGVAYAAHIGGFIAGYLLVRLFDRGPARPAFRTVQAPW